MSFDLETLYNLLPAVDRINDANEAAQLALDPAQNGPLKALLTVIAGQVAVLEEDLAQLYDDQFIETCAGWVVPYIGDLLGVRALHSVNSQTSSPRAEVANTIGYRRRKGTAAMLEQLAQDVTGWPAHVVEYFQLLATTQYMNHLRPANLAVPDLRRWEPLERLPTPFESVAHTIDVRRIASGSGRYNIPNIGISLWRLASYPLTSSPAVKLDARRYLLSPLGNNTPLFSLPQPPDELAQLTGPTNVPMPISRRVLDAYLEDYYGPGKSLLLNVNGKDILPDPQQPTQTLADLIVACDLSDLKDAKGKVIGWAHQPQDKIAIDPALGRIAFPANQSAPRQVIVSFHYGFSADMGSGEYSRSATFTEGLHPIQQVPAPSAKIQDALDALDTQAGGGVVEITDSGRYSETLKINVTSGQRIELRAADGHRPTLVLTGDFQISGASGAEVTLNGLLISGGHLLVSGTLSRLYLRHCTIVPGLSLAIDGTPQQPTEPGLIITAEETTVEIDHCIIGGVRAVESASVTITNSIIDATSETGVAYAAPDGSPNLAGGQVHIDNSTIIGKLHTTLIDLASNSISQALLADADTWKAPVLAERRQEGCVRFSFLPLASFVPRRYRCQPEDAGDATRVQPQFTSLRYGDPGYGQLSRRCALEIRTGADDEAEMGAFHDLLQPQREINLRVRLDEYLRFGLEAGIFYTT